MLRKAWLFLNRKYWLHHVFVNTSYLITYAKYFATRKESNVLVPARIIHSNPRFFIIYHRNLSPVIFWVLEGGPLHFFTPISFPCSLWNTNFPYKPRRAKLQAWFIRIAVIIYDVSPGNVQEKNNMQMFTLNIINSVYLHISQKEFN